MKTSSVAFIECWIDKKNCNKMYFVQCVSTLNRTESGNTLNFDGIGLPGKFDAWYFDWVDCWWQTNMQTPSSIIPNRYTLFSLNDFHWSVCPPGDISSDLWTLDSWQLDWCMILESIDITRKQRVYSWILSSSYRERERERESGYSNHTSTVGDVIVAIPFTASAETGLNASP